MDGIRLMRYHIFVRNT